MNEDRRFRDIMDDLEKTSGQRFVRTPDGNGWTVPVCGGIVQMHVAYRPDSGSVIVFADVGPFFPTTDDTSRARILLEMNWQWRETHGFTIAVDDETSRVVIVGRYAARRIDSAEAFASCLAEGAGLVRELRQGLAEFEDLVEADAEGALGDHLEED